MEKLDIGHQITARRLMHIILYDNGAININEPEAEKRYPLRNLVEITLCCKLFFGNNEDMVTDKHLEQIATGEYMDNIKTYGNLNGYTELITALNNYFNTI